MKLIARMHNCSGRNGILIFFLGDLSLYMYACEYEVCKYKYLSMCIYVAGCDRLVETVSSVTALTLMFSFSRPEEIPPALLWLIYHIRIRAGKISAGSHTLHFVLLLPGYSWWLLLVLGPAQMTRCCFCCWWMVPQSEECFLWNIVLLAPFAVCFLTIKFRLKFSKAASIEMYVTFETQDCLSVYIVCTPSCSFWKPLHDIQLFITDYKGIRASHHIQTWTHLKRGSKGTRYVLESILNICSN